MQTLVDAGYPYLVSSVLSGRGITTAAQAADALRQSETLPFSPLLLRDMDKAVARIRRALDEKETIAVFGDYDVDGITSTCLVTDFLRRAGAQCLWYIPRRIEDGYGLNTAALDMLKAQGARLVITVDCGVTGVDEADYAASIGLDMIITDHHECKEPLPRAAAVINPHRSDDTYPFADLAGVGVALKLVLAVGGADNAAALYERYCSLAAIGTIADVMRMTGENRILVHHGLAVLPSCPFVGLHALLQEAGLTDALSSTKVGFVLAPRINAAGRMGRADLAAELLLTDDPLRAEALAQELCALNRERQSVEQEIYSEAVDRIEQMPDDERSALVLADDAWHQGVVGIVASRLAEKYSCPCFMIRLNGATGKGSCRSFGGFNLYQALDACGDLLVGFGGHALAAGFTIEADKIPAFRRRMNRCATDYFGSTCPVSSIEIDAAVDHIALLTMEEVEQLALLEPYGADNPRPLFCARGLTLESLQNVGQNKHLKLRLSKGRQTLDGIFFSMNSTLCDLTVGERVDAAFYLNINEFRGNRTVQLQLADLRPSHSPSVREKAEIDLFRCLDDGRALSAQEAVRLLPERSQFVSAWRFLDGAIPAEHSLCMAGLPLLRALARAVGGQEPFLRAMTCLCIFCERGLLAVQGGADELSLRRLPADQKVDLNASPYMARLQTILTQRR